MTTKKDTNLQSDFAKLKHELDGSYKRIPSAFRSFIEKGGQFEAERGEDSALFSLGLLLKLKKIATIYMSRMRAVRVIPLVLKR
jgi:hypothetical protein